MISGILSKQEQDSKLQKLQDFKTILAVIYLLFKIIINLKNIRKYVYSVYRSTSIVKLLVYKTVKYEVINVEFHSRDLPLNNSVIMVK